MMKHHFFSEFKSFSLSFSKGKKDENTSNGPQNIFMYNGVQNDFQYNIGGF
jgi:hypothetical protein